MPSSIVTQLIREVAELKAQVGNLMAYQRWQMGILAAILITVVTKAVWR